MVDQIKNIFLVLVTKSLNIKKHAVYNIHRLVHVCSSFARGTSGQVATAH
jgi:hypothetical protein